ncbi:hypothetical protein RhiirC2_754158, partial [Rhizophagus irregularis]
MSIEKQLSQIINSQKNLEKNIFSHDINKYTSRVSGDSNSSKSLKIIIFYRIDFRNILHIKKAFEQLNVLESIHILECLIFNSNFIQQIIDLDKPLKLISLFIMNENDQRSLFMSEEDKNLQIESMQLLFQKSGEYLENIGIDSYVNDVLKCRALEFINNYCERIKFFDIHMSNIQKVHIVLDSVKIFGQNLNYFSIGIFIHHEKNESIIEMLLKLAQVLPCKLEYLELYFTGTPIVKNVWEVFLK